MFTRLRLPLLLIALVFAVFSRVPTADFVNYDDHVHIYKNPYLDPVTAAGVLHFWLNPFDKPEKPKTKEELYNSPYEQLYAPLTFTAWALIATQAKLPQKIDTLDIGPHALSPTPYHWFSVALHLGSVLLVFAILCLLLESKAAAFVGALFFGIHPLQVEAVAWITQGNLLLSTFLALLALWSSLRAAHDKARVLSPLNLLATLCFVLALFAKPSAVALPLMVLPILWWKGWLEPKRTCWTLAPWFVLAGAFVLLNQSLQLPPDADIITPIWARPFLVGDAFAFYLAKIALPWGLVNDYGRMPHLVLAHWWGYATWILPALVLLYVWKKRLTQPWLLVAAIILAVNVLPTSGIVPYYYHKHSTVADRYLYLGMFGAALALAAAVRPLLGAPRTIWQRAGVLLVGAWLLFLGGTCYAQTLTWHDSFALWSRLVAVKPDGWRGQTNYARSLWRRDRKDEGMTHFRRAVELDPKNAGVHANLGDALAALNQLPAAVQEWKTALHLDPKYADARIQFANYLKSQGQTEAALAQYREVIKERPTSAGTHYNIGLILSERGELPAATVAFREALRLTPDDAEIHNALALALARQNDIAGATHEWQSALALDPKLADAHINYGTLLAMSGRMDEAISHWKTALEINPKNPQVHHNLATALYAKGQRAEAIAHWKTALRLQPNYPEAKKALESTE
jgi:tetratricopeptide (TPR) repeat protein